MTRGLLRSHSARDVWVAQGGEPRDAGVQNVAELSHHDAWVLRVAEPHDAWVGLVAEPHDLPQPTRHVSTNSATTHASCGFPRGTRCGGQLRNYPHVMRRPNAQGGATPQHYNNPRLMRLPPISHGAPHMDTFPISRIRIREIVITKSNQISIRAVAQVSNGLKP